MNKAFIAIASVCIVISVIAPTAIYTYYNDIVEFNKLQMLDVQQDNENLKEEINNLKIIPYSIEPYLVTTLG